MSQWIETIRLEDGQFNNLAYHERRMQRTLASVSANSGHTPLVALLRAQSPPPHGLYRCRVVYDAGRVDVEFIPYTARTINSLKLVYDDALGYSQKFRDRQVLEKHFEQRGECDDVLIVQKGLITDASAANIVFRKGNEWVTPRACLLSGTQRQLLLDEHRIREEEVPVSNLSIYKAFKLINAMVMFEAQEVSTRNIF